MKDKKRIVLIASGLVFSLLVVFSLVKYAGMLSEEIFEEEELVEETVYDVYGIPVGAFEIEPRTVQKNQTLSHLFSGFDLGNASVDKIVNQIREFFDPRRIRAGNSYYCYYQPDSVNPQLAYFIYDISAINYLVVDLTDTLKVELGEKEVTTIEKSSSGIITSSLWNTMMANNLNPELAVKLSEVLAWEVDFYRIQKGDRFKVLYFEKYVGEESVGIDRIDAVHFIHQGREVLGYRFEQDSIYGYFNPEGESLRKVFLKAPLKFSRITSGFTSSRFHPVLKYNRPHYGTDYAAPEGTPIMTVGDGVVTEARYGGGNGNYVRIRHNSVYETQYLHMSGFAKGIKPGTRVRQGDIIGYVGSTGLATGPHVCFRFWKNGQQVNHLREEFPSADPLNETYMPSFKILSDSLNKKLNAVVFPEVELISSVE